jgi:hypothetical protein
MTWRALSISPCNKVTALGMKARVRLGFHSVGCNTGDTCTVSLPPWVLNIAESNPDVLYTDAEGCRHNEYLSLGVDDEPLFQAGPGMYHSPHHRHAGLADIAIVCRVIGRIRNHRLLSLVASYDA